MAAPPETPQAGAAAPLTEAEVDAWRARFPTVARCTYLINNSLGAMPASVPAALASYAQQWQERGVEAWRTEWFPKVRSVVALLEGLLGAPAGSVVVHQNVATLTAVLVSALDFSGRRNGIVMTDLEWPSHGYLAEGQRALGAQVVTVPTDGLAVDTERLLAAIDERTAVVVVSHVLFRSSAITDVAAVAARAHEVGAVCLVDGYHAVGHMPVDVTAIGCDAYVGGSVKWLCGGRGVGYLYLRPELSATLAPRDVGWLGHARPFGFEPAWEPAEGAMGWLGGTPGMPALYAAAEGYAAITEATPARIRATSVRLTTALVEGALARGFAVRSPVAADQRAGSVTIDLGDKSEAASQRLIDAGIIVDFRPRAGIRVGAHFFNTVAECESLLDALSG